MRWPRMIVPSRHATSARRPGRQETRAPGDWRSASTGALDQAVAQRRRHVVACARLVAPDHGVVGRAVELDVVAEAGDHGRALVRSLVAQYGSSARMLDGRSIDIAMMLLPPGTTGGPVKVETVAAIPPDRKIGLWVQEENAKGRVCACGCGRRIDTRRRYYYAEPVG